MCCDTWWYGFTEAQLKQCGAVYTIGVHAFTMDFYFYVIIDSTCMN
jgi:hypothetical protein|eukprot:COSAG06_NODE_3660_length_5055_cov_2.790153_3_plen_46_part_00